MVALKVKFPKRGTETPFPFLSYFAMYEPNPFQIAVTVFSSMVLLWAVMNLLVVFNEI